MKFPNISEVATLDVVKIDISDDLNHAINKMHKFNHRNVVVEDGINYYILTATDILHLKLKDYCFNTKLKDIELTPMILINKNDNILDTIQFLENPVEYLCATNDDGSLYGILTHTDIITNIDPETMMENYRIGDLINMSKHIQKVPKQTITSEVLKEMSDNSYDCVVIIEDMIPVGILTTKDIMEILKNKVDLTIAIENYMSSPIVTLSSNASIKEAIAFMKEKHFKRIIVVGEDKKLVGLILQKELIALSYSKWSMLMKEYSDELAQINSLLEKKNKKYEKMAVTDSLTGLYNRYKFSELFISEYTTMAKRDNSMSIIMIDIDHFKLINDNHGHNMGDKVLVQISNILLKYLRNVDIIARWGGEEFIALLPTATVENGVKLAEKIREAIESYEMPNGLKVTASFGVTQVIKGDSMESAIGRADEALYEAKNSGRNQVKSI